jgi:flagellar hook-basal body complex protein FliE
MKLGEISSFLPKISPQKLNKEIPTNEKFDSMLGDFIKGVNTDQLDSEQITADFVDGKNVELHEVMIAGEKAKTSLDLLMQLRNKTIDMYKELTRMQ